MWHYREVNTELIRKGINDFNPFQRTVYNSHGNQSTDLHYNSNDWSLCEMQHWAEMPKEKGFFKGNCGKLVNLVTYLVI